MKPSSCTPEGQPNRCAVCGHSVCIDPSSTPIKDAPCPHYGQLLFFADPPEDQVLGNLLGADQTLMRKFDCLKRAIESTEKRNWAVAADLFATAVKMAPDNLTYRQSVRGCLRKKYRDNKTGASLSFLRLLPIRWRIKRARKMRNWPEMDRLAEVGLALNPWDRQLNADLAEAARQRGFLDIATFAAGQAT